MIRTRTIAVVVSVAIAVGGGAVAPGQQANASPPLAAQSAELAAQAGALDAQAADLAAHTGGRSVLINELSNGDSESDAHGFIELRNWGSQDVDLTGWNLFRCSESGLRSNYSRPEAQLSGKILKPGETFTISAIGMPGDAHITQPYSGDGFGAILEGPDGEEADAVGVFPNEPWPTTSECTSDENLPNVLSFAANESWQRVAATGHARADFIIARSTPDAPNTGAPNANEPARAASGTDREIVISEFSPAGPGGSDDEFVEIQNVGDTAVDVSGWQLYRCTATGRLRPSTLQVVVDADTTLQPGQRWVAASEGYGGPSDARYVTPLADVASGLLVATESGAFVDKVAMTPYPDSACQDVGAKLTAVLDYVAGESFQLTEGGYVVAPRTPGARNAVTELSVMSQSFEYPRAPRVAISEVATDPGDGVLPAGAQQRNFIEIANYSPTAIDIGGWSIRRCEATGIRSRSPQHVVPAGTTLAPSETYLIAREGTALESSADASYATSLNFLGAGVWLDDNTGRRIDSVGIFQVNEMDGSNVTQSPCSKGLPLVTYLPDRSTGESFQRSRFTGVDIDDFVVRVATPGVIDRAEWVNPTDLVARPGLAREEERQAAATADVAVSRGRAVTIRQPAESDRARILEAFSGVTEEAPLSTLRGSAETRMGMDGAGGAAGAGVASGFAASEDSSWGYPYQRFVLDAHSLAAGDTLTWAGTTHGRNDLALYIWDATAQNWRAVDTGTPQHDGGSVQLSGTIEAGDISEAGDGVSGSATASDTASATATATVGVLVQDSRRATPTVSTVGTGEFEDPENFDFAVSHITDTQYLSESYPEVYAEAVGWIIDNAPTRKIAFATHTGDLIQNWVDPNQSEERARVEFERASQLQGLLDDAEIPNSVLPGNHDNKRGQDDSLFNEYFPPSRYSGNEWYRGSIAPGDNTANYSTFEHDGAQFLMLSLPYAYGEREIEWARQVVLDNPDRNVVVSTHEHVTPKSVLEPARRSESSRWLSQGRQLWERVIAPNRNVIAVLSGHFHGLGQIVTENAGGIDGHTVVELLADYQEFRTHDGDRATGFQRLLQFDLDGGAIAVDTFSARLNAQASFEYDYPQFVPENGAPTALANGRPWRIIEAGVQNRYDATDDEFTVAVSFQYPKAVATEGMWLESAEDPAPDDTRARAQQCGNCVLTR